MSGQVHALLEQSFKSRPSAIDFVRCRQYTESNWLAQFDEEGPLFPTKLVNREDFQLFKSLPVDTLMLIFYYREGTFSQYLAALELKLRNWRFHSKFGAWFKRSPEGPKSVNATYEYGNYSLFDISSNNWSVRTKSDFTFEYEALEDEVQIPPTLAS